MISGVVVAMPGMLWCSAYQRRSKPSRSTARASSTAPSSAAALVLPLERGTRSRADNGRGEGGMGRGSGIENVWPEGARRQGGVLLCDGDDARFDGRIGRIHGKRRVALGRQPGCLTAACQRACLRRGNQRVGPYRDGVRCRGGQRDHLAQPTGQRAARAHFLSPHRSSLASSEGARALDHGNRRAPASHSRSLLFAVVGRLDFHRTPTSAAASRPLLPELRAAIPARKHVRSDSRTRRRANDLGDTMIALADLQRCFAGVIPSIITTCSRSGVPNVTYLSQIFRVDERRIALSCQFFNKTKQNVAENPFANVELIDPLTFQTYDLDLRYAHSEISGPLFEKMATRIQAIASHTGMLGVFKLLSADVYEVLAIREVEGLLGPPTADNEADSEEAPMSLRTELRALSVVTERLRHATDLDGLLSTLLDALRDELSFEHAMLLLPDETGKRLVSLASRGYGETGIGAEVLVGDGLIGTVALTQQTIRISNVSASLD